MGKSNRALIELRRLRVSSLLLRKLTQREIVEILPRYKIVNPDTGKPYSLGTINHDIQQLRAEWQAQAAENIEAHKGRVLAEIQEVKREAWGQKDLRVVLAALGQERALLSLDGEISIQVAVDAKVEGEMGVDFGEFDEAELDQFITNMMTLLGRRGE